MGTVTENLKIVENKISAAAEKSGRKRSDVLLVAVTKTHPPKMINEAIKAGVTDIGENKPQEIRDKYDDVLKVNWHMIGHLQTNKVKYVVGKCVLIHSVDSVKLAEEIDRQARKTGIVQDILIEVNISGEETKSGINPEKIYEMLDVIKDFQNIRVRGLMTIAPKTDNSITSKLHFDNIHKLFVDIRQKKYDNISMDYLSMGMSGDYEQAIECGANIVRVGSAIFGARNYSK